MDCASYAVGLLICWSAGKLHWQIKLLFGLSLVVVGLKQNRHCHFGPLAMLEHTVNYIVQLHNPATMCGTVWLRKSSAKLNEF